MAAPNAQDSVLARLVRIIAKHFTPRARSKKSRTDGDQHDGDDGADHDGNGGEGGDGQGEGDSGEVATDDYEDDSQKENESESVELQDDDDDQIENERLAYFMGGTPRPTPSKYSPWSPSAFVPGPVNAAENKKDTQPQPETLDDVQKALRKIEHLDQIFDLIE